MTAAAAGGGAELESSSIDGGGGRTFSRPELGLSEVMYAIERWNPC